MAFSHAGFLDLEPSLLTQHLSHVATTASEATTTMLSAVPREAQLSSTRITSDTQTFVSRTLERDLGVSVRDVLGNATQTGVEEQADDLAEVVKALVDQSGEVPISMAH